MAITLTIHRKKQMKHYFKPFSIFLNNDQIGELYESENLTVDIQEGKHLLKICIGASITEYTLNLSGNEPIKIDVYDDNVIPLLSKPKPSYRLSHSPQSTLVRKDFEHIEDYWKSLIEKKAYGQFYLHIILNSLKGLSPLFIAILIFIQMLFFSMETPYKMLITAIPLGMTLSILWGILTAYFLSKDLNSKNKA